MPNSWKGTKFGFLLLGGGEEDVKAKEVKGEVSGWRDNVEFTGWGRGWKAKGSGWNVQAASQPSRVA